MFTMFISNAGRKYCISENGAIKKNYNLFFEWRSKQHFLDNYMKIQFVWNYQKQREENGRHKVHTVMTMDIGLQIILKTMVYHKLLRFSRISTQQ